MLAAFLLGNEIEVETRHITTDVGFRFKTSLTQEAVQVERVEGLSVGTRIRVSVSRAAFESLGTVQADNSTVSKPAWWDWYVLETPSVVRLLGKDKRQLPQTTVIALKDWRIAETRLPLTIHWRTWKEKNRWARRRAKRGAGPGLSCNGIFVTRSAKLPEILPHHCNSTTHRVATPQLHVADADGILPLGLTRKEIVNEEYGFERDLFVSVMKDYLASLLATFPEVFAPTEIAEALNRSPILRENHGVVPDCLLSRDGFCLPFSEALRVCRTELRRILWVTSRECLDLMRAFTSWDCVVYQQDLGMEASRRHYFTSDSHEGISSIRRTDGKTIEVGKQNHDENSARKGSRFVEEWTSWEEEGSDHDPKTGTWTKKITKNTTRWLLSTPDVRSSEYPFEALLKKHKARPRNIPFVADLVFRDSWRDGIGPSVIDEMWIRVLGNEWIPWKKSDRRARFPKVYHELAPYLKHYGE